MKTITIIGGGVSGLSAGIHGQLLGYKTTIYEKNPVMGGTCATWERAGYHIDGSLHWLTGTEPGNGVNDMWRTLGVIDDSTQIIRTDSVGRYELGGGSFELYTDLDKLEEELLRIAPDDGKYIKQMMRDIHAVMKMNMPAEAPVQYLPLKKKLAYGMPGLKMLLQLKNRMKMTNREYGQRFKSPVLRAYFGSWPQGDDQHMGWLFKTAMHARGNAEYVVGGSKGIVDRMVAKYLSLGGEIHTSMAAVSADIDQQGVCHGVTFKDGTKVASDYYLTALDPYVALKDILKDRYKVPEFEKRFAVEDYFIGSSFEIYFGLDFAPENFEETVTFEIEPMKIACDTAPIMTVRQFSGEDKFAPEGHVLMSVNITQHDDSYAYWKKLRDEDLQEYKAQKQKVTDEIINRILVRFPDWEGHIQVVDMHTPATYNRYTGAFHGGWMSFRGKSGAAAMTHNGKIPGVKNLFLTGQWMQPPGGLPVAAAMSKFSVLMIDRMNK